MHSELQNLLLVVIKIICFATKDIEIVLFKEVTLPRYTLSVLMHKNAWDLWGDDKTLDWVSIHNVIQLQELEIQKCEAHKHKLTEG